MGRQPRKHDPSNGNAGAGQPPPKRPRSSERPLVRRLADGATPPAPSAKSRCDAVRPAVRNSPASLERGCRSPVTPGGDFQRKDSDGLVCLTPDSTKAMFQQDDHEKGECFPGVVLSKTGDCVVKMAAANVEDLCVEDLRDNELITVIEGPSKPLPSIPLVQDEEAVQLAKTLVNEQVKKFMKGVSEPGVLQSRLSKITSLLVQATSMVSVLHDEIPPQIHTQNTGYVTQISELEQQLEELSKKLCSTEDELEVTKAELKTTQAAMLEAQSDRMTAITAMNSIAMRVGASFARLGEILLTPPSVVDSLEESIKQLTMLVSRLGPVTLSHGLSLAKSSLTFGVAALLCREKGIKGLLEPSGMDTRQFVRSQGPEFHSLISQVVEAMEQRLSNTHEGGEWRILEPPKNQDNQQTIVIGGV
uniref:Uncharacterized protein n=1 Tax=Leersia perrieri TaxID=77586 RepID=A0A0D9WFQ5_9ORYZ